MKNENNNPRKSNIIGICVSQLQNHEVSGLTHTIYQCARVNGYHVMVFGCFAKMDFPTPHSNGEASIFENIPMKDLKALILMGQTILHRELLLRLRDEAVAVGTPVITVDYELDKCFNIRLDYLSCFKRLVRHVIEGHHRHNPYFMAGFKGNAFSEERLDAFVEVLEENGMPVVQEHIAYGDFWGKPARRVCEQWMERTDDFPDAIICANDTMALAVIDVLEENGYHVPEDVIVTGFDGIELIKYCIPRLTTGRVDQEEIAEQIMHIVKRVETDPETAPQSVLVPFHILRGESCGCAPIHFQPSNQYVLELNDRIDRKQIHIDRIFEMMTEMTEGHSMLDVLKRFPECAPDMIDGDCQVFVNEYFCRHTDIPISKGFRKDDILLLLEQRDGKTSLPLLKVKSHSIDMIPQEILEKTDRLLYLPLHWQNEVYGYISLECSDREFDYERLKDFMMAMSQILGIVRNQSQLYDMYIRDSLTGLYNRRGFYGELASRMKSLKGKKCYIFLASVDLDHLKSINDTHGHGEGDVAIRAVADALVEAAGDNGICARFGGDEYVAVCLWNEGKVPEDFVAGFQKRLLLWIDDWNQAENKPYELGASTGVILEPIHDVDDIDELMKKADDNMYDCKVRHHSIRARRRV